MVTTPSPKTLAQTALVFASRACLFQFCRIFLLRSLVHDLRNISSSSTSSSESGTTLHSSISSHPGGVKSAHSTQSGPGSESELEMELELENIGGAALLPQPATNPNPTSRFSLGRFGPRGMKTPLNSSSGPSGDGTLIATFHSRASTTVFALCFSESCTLFVLVGMQAIDVLSESARLVNWYISLFTLLAIILLVIPLLQSLFLTYPPARPSLPLSSPSPPRPRRAVRRRDFAALIPYLIFIYLFTLIPLPASTPPEGFVAMLANVTLSRLVVAGVIILGLLSGFGAVRNAWEMVTNASAGRGGLWNDGDVASEDGDLAERSLKKVREDLGARRVTLEKRNTQTAVATDVAESSSARERQSWMSRVFNGSDNETASLVQEIAGLEALEVQMTRRVDAIKSYRARAAFSRTIQGRLWNFFGGWGLGGYCVYRIINSALNLLLAKEFGGTWYGRGGSDSTSPSPLADGSFALGIVDMFPALQESFDLTPNRVVSLSRQFSLLMVGFIVLSSVRLVLRGVNRVLRMTSKSLGASFMLLILAQLMGTYLLSTLVQIRASFPPSSGPTSDSSSLFSTLPAYEVFGPLFDGSFLLSALVSGFARWLGGRVNGYEG